MTRASIREYAEAVRERYLSASKMEMGRILDEFTKVTGCHRKAAIRLIRRVYRKTGKKQGRPRQYDAAVTSALRSVWDATDRLCSTCGEKRWRAKRLQPFLPELITVLRRHGEGTNGFYLTTLSTVDVASGWSECIGVWGKGQVRVGGAVHRVRQRLPFPLLGLEMRETKSKLVPNRSLYLFENSTPNKRQMLEIELVTVTLYQ